MHMQYISPNKMGGASHPPLVTKPVLPILRIPQFPTSCLSITCPRRKVQEIPEEEVVLRGRVHDLLLKANENNERLTASAASTCLRNAGLGLRFVQVPAIMSTVEEGPDGLLAAHEVANAVAGVMCALKQLHTRQHESAEHETVISFKASRQAEGFAQVTGINADDFKVRVLGSAQSLS